MRQAFKEERDKNSKELENYMSRLETILVEGCFQIKTGNIFL